MPSRASQSLFNNSLSDGLPYSARSCNICDSQFLIAFCVLGCLPDRPCAASRKCHHSNLLTLKPRLRRIVFKVQYFDLASRQLQQRAKLLEPWPINPSTLLQKYQSPPGLRAQ
ncbi:hypothetical protein CERSUDRAFT_110906 [Gelatoporia subvermispora B]|uniref:Uncharacterized protein n=1 Tax=Ceriporiopsis subvermispora (strain B) TaxID=914234 RepID=M2PU88_CERS8|nr:hypothetical protein CERSUDRAFT_110906 [Gelatoporia subvermispora B]